MAKDTVTKREAEEWLRRLDRVVTTTEPNPPRPGKVKTVHIPLDFSDWSDEDLQGCLLTGVLSR